MFLNQSSN